MPKKIALDYDESELRIVVANCSPSRVQVTDAQVIELSEDDSVSEKLRKYIVESGLQKNDTLVAIGRGKAELRELQLPPVPEDELPDLVRFQAIRSFASASERAIVDYLITQRGSENNTLIAAAVGPNELDKIRELCATSELVPKRVALRPLTAASMYLRHAKPKQVCVMIDLLSDDAEIVVANSGKVIFVRTVRLPQGDAQRSKAIATELRRTMVACGQSVTPEHIIVWGTEEVHKEDVAAIKETIGSADVRAVDPFDLVDLQLDRSQLPAHIGRLAPLVGLLSSDEASPESLIDFLNPRERPEDTPDRVKQGLMIAISIAAVLLVGFFVYSQFSQWDQKIALLTEEVSTLKPQAEAAGKSVARTERIDQFLDSDVNWLDELRRFVEVAPPSSKLIVETVSMTADARNGGGDLRFTGRVTDPSVIDVMEENLRDGTHSVIGKGSREQKDAGVYRWEFTETIEVEGSTIRSTRYQRMAEIEQALSEKAEAEETPEESSEAEAEAEPPDQEPAEEKPAEEEPAEETESDDDSSDEKAADPILEAEAAPQTTQPEPNENEEVSA